MSVSVPSQYQSYVSAAATTLGIPEQVVAAQIQLESDWNPKAVSPAGAEGIAQFEPGTFASYGHGSPFDVGDAFAAYTNYMRTLLHQEGGDVRKALEAYNAGPGNLGAGTGYADTILAKAGQSGDPSAAAAAAAVAAAGNIASGFAGNAGVVSWPTGITSFFTAGVDILTGQVSWIKAFFQPSTYIRIGAGLFGTAFLIVAVVLLARHTRSAP